MTALSINITQEPAYLNSLQRIQLVAEINYPDDGIRQQSYGNLNNHISYEWLYSTNEGRTFKTLNENSYYLNIGLDTININFIYKFTFFIWI